MSTTSAPGTEFSEDFAGVVGEIGEIPAGVGPWRLAGRRLRRNRVALFFGLLFLLIVVVCLLAPVYSHDIAHIGPDTNNITGTVRVGGKVRDVVSAQGLPIGPTWHSRYFFGADANGRDTAVRLLYGGRNSLEIGFVATLITMLLAVALGALAGFYRGWGDAILSRIADVLWAFPAVLFGVTLGTVLATGGFLFIHHTFLLAPAVVIGITYLPYVFKPVRAQVLQLREREFIDAARQQGLSSWQIMYSELLPNLSSTIVVFIPLILANAILLEAGLSYLGAGVQPPNPSWGTMISAGIDEIPAAFSNVLAPGFMLVLAVMSANIFGDGVRDALDPRAKVRIAR